MEDRSGIAMCKGCMDDAMESGVFYTKNPVRLSNPVDKSDTVVGYLGDNGTLTDFHGNKIGTYRTLSTWKTPRSYVSSTYSSVEAFVDGKRYTGRSAGRGMRFYGKRSEKGKRNP
jgi:hypothetical protein